MCQVAQIQKAGVVQASVVDQCGRIVSGAIKSDTLYGNQVVYAGQSIRIVTYAGEGACMLNFPIVSCNCFALCTAVAKQWLDTCYPLIKGQEVSSVGFCKDIQSLGFHNTWVPYISVANE